MTRPSERPHAMLMAERPRGPRRGRDVPPCAVRRWAVCIGIALAGAATCAVAQAPRAAVADLKPRLERTQADPKALEAALKAGRQVAAVCAHCHGESGVSIQPETPNLAGQNAAYLAEQMRLFAEGRRRNDFMEGMIRAMNADERVSVVLFYAAQNVPPRAPRDPALAARGRDTYDRNCFRCHGSDGRGNAQIARLAGQQAPYVAATLRRYRSGTGPRVNALMSEATRLLTDPEIEAVAAFVGTLP